MKSQIKTLSGIVFFILLFTIIMSSSACNRIERNEPIIVKELSYNEEGLPELTSVDTIQAETIAITPSENAIIINKEDN